MLAETQAAQSDRPIVYVHLGHGMDVEDYHSRYLKGTEPDETPYGFHLARDEGFDVHFSRDATRLPDPPGRRSHRIRTGFDVIHAFANRKRVRQADVIWTMTEGGAFALSCLMLMGLIPRRPIISNCVWLLDKWKTLPGYKKLVYQVLSRFITVMTVHSENCVPLARRVFPNIPSERMYFGINTDVYRLKEPKILDASPSIRIFALGNDKTRDWNTLLDAFGNDDRFQIILICWWVDEKYIEGYRNVEIVRTSVIADFLRCYVEADVVAIPMLDNTFSGITVALEAAALGKPILSSRTGGVPTYFGDDELFYAPVGDAIAMREVILASDPESRRRRAEAAQKRFVENDYTTRAVIGRYAEITRRVMAGDAPQG